MTNELKASTSLTPPPGFIEAADAGRGVSIKTEDLLLPLLRLLQSNSPQVDKRGANYVQDAEAGDWWLRGAIKPIRSGTAGIEVVPCLMQRSWVEWLVGRQGFVSRHLSMPADVETRMLKDDSGRERPSLIRRGNGNVIQDSRDFYLLVEGSQPCLLPCTSTSHTFAREWNSYFLQIRNPPGSGAIMPSFARRYLLRTTQASNALGKWFKPKFEDLGWVSAAEYQVAKELNQIAERGAVRVEMPLDDGAAAPASARLAPGAPGVAA